MPKLEQIQHKRTKVREEAVSTFPEDYELQQAHGGSAPDNDDLLERIEHVLSEATARALGHSTGIEAA